MIFADGVYVTDGRAAPVFRAVRSPAAGELQALVQQMAERIGRLLEKRGLIERDAESAWLSGEPVQAGSLDELLGHCITWRIAAGPRAGQKVFTLQTVAARDEGEGRSRAAQAGGFSLHAGVSIRPGQRAKLERLCRYVSRWPLAQDRLTLSATGQVCYGFKTRRPRRHHAWGARSAGLHRAACGAGAAAAAASDALSRCARPAQQPACADHAGRARQGEPAHSPHSAGR